MKSLKADMILRVGPYSQEQFESGQIHAPLTSEGSVGTDQEIL